MMPAIVGKWKVNSGQFMGLVYQFNADGTFVMEMNMYGVKGSGTYTINDKSYPKEINIHFKEHSSGTAGIGVYKGIWEIQNEQLSMKVGTTNGERWLDTSGYVIYKKND